MAWTYFMPVYVDNGEKMESLRFLHIPKTAGTTFTEILRRQYRGKKIFSFIGDYQADRERYETECRGNDSDSILFVCHAPIVTGIEAADKATTITILRDPISRVKSFCQHIAEGKNKDYAKRHPPETFSLDEFLDAEYNELTNHQTRLLSKHRVPGSPYNTDDVTIDSKDRAIENLFNRIAYYGIQEYFDESLMLFSSALGWRMPFYVWHNKKDKSKVLKFEQHHLDRIREMNAVDIELYRVARKRFEEIVASDDFDRARLQRFRRMNKLTPFVKGGVVGFSVRRLKRLGSVIGLNESR